MQIIKIAAVIVSFGVMGVTSARANIPLGTNVIVNGGAETGSLSGWVTIGAVQAVSYGTGGGFPTSSSPGPVDRGTYFFGGGVGLSTSAKQILDVTTISTPITFVLSGYLGGFANQSDDAALSATFYSLSGGGGTVLGSSSIGPVTPAERADVTGLLLRNADGTIPEGTESISFVLSMQRYEGSYDDGYADNLSFIASAQDPAPTPEPAFYGLVAAGLSVMVAAALRRKRASETLN